MPRHDAASSELHEGRRGLADDDTPPTARAERKRARSTTEVLYSAVQRHELGALDALVSHVLTRRGLPPGVLGGSLRTVSSGSGEVLHLDETCLPHPGRGVGDGETADEELASGEPGRAGEVVVSTQPLRAIAKRLCPRCAEQLLMSSGIGTAIEQRVALLVELDRLEAACAGAPNLGHLAEAARALGALDAMEALYVDDTELSLVIADLVKGAHATVAAFRSAVLEAVPEAGLRLAAAGLVQPRAARGAITEALGPDHAALVSAHSGQVLDALWWSRRAFLSCFAAEQGLEAALVAARNALALHLGEAWGPGATKEIEAAAQALGAQWSADYAAARLEDQVGGRALYLIEARFELDGEFGSVFAAGELGDRERLSRLYGLGRSSDSRVLLLAPRIVAERLRFADEQLTSNESGVDEAGPLTTADTPAVLELAVELVGDGLSVGEALEAARELAGRRSAASDPTIAC